MNLLARYAEAIFWLARYVERAENLARILDVQETFSRDSQGQHDWGAVLALNGDAEDFFKTRPAATAESVLRYYVMDRENPTSIVMDVKGARENARMLRPLISTEMWGQLNVFYNRVLGFTAADLAEERLARTCAMIKEACDAHVGITAGTFYRDEAWNFYELGRAIECADQTTRLLDVKFTSFGGPDGLATTVADESQWVAVLRSAASFQAFRRSHPRGIRPPEVAAFLYCDWKLPRSVAHCLGVIEHNLTELRRQYGLRGTDKALEHIDGLRDDLHVDKVNMVLAKSGLNDFNDWLQHGLSDLTDIIAQSFFGHAPPTPATTPAPAPAAAPTQSQSQG